MLLKIEKKMEQIGQIWEEKQMTPIVVQWLLEQNYIVKKEVFTLNNCDVVACKLNKERSFERVSAKQATPLLGIRWENSKDTIFGWQPIYDEIVAIELKLKRTSDVIWQAGHHKNIITKSYIGMPMDMAQKSINKADKAGVGVIGINHTCKILLEAPTNKKPTRLADYLAELFWQESRRSK